VSSGVYRNGVAGQAAPGQEATSEAGSGADKTPVQTKLASGGGFGPAGGFGGPAGSRGPAQRKQSGK